MAQVVPSPGLGNGRRLSEPGHLLVPAMVHWLCVAMLGEQGPGVVTKSAAVARRSLAIVTCRQTAPPRAPIGFGRTKQESKNCGVVGLSTFCPFTALSASPHPVRSLRCRPHHILSIRGVVGLTTSCPFAA